MDTRIAGKLGGDKTSKRGKQYYSDIGMKGANKRWKLNMKSDIIDTSWKQSQKAPTNAPTKD